MEQRTEGSGGHDPVDGGDLLSNPKVVISALSPLKRIEVLALLYSIRDLFEEGRTSEDEALSAKVAELKRIIGPLLYIESV